MEEGVTHEAIKCDTHSAIAAMGDRVPTLRPARVSLVYFILSFFFWEEKQKNYCLEDLAEISWV